MHTHAHAHTHTHTHNIMYMYMTFAHTTIWRNQVCSNLWIGVYLIQKL